VIGGVVGAAGAAAAFAAMVVTPLASRGGTTRRRAAAVVVGGLATTSFDRLRVGWGGRRSGASALALTGLGWAVEEIGTRTGRPFGAYAYTDRLRPAVGTVPAIVPVAWFAMAVPARETAHAALGRRSTPVRRVLLGAAALTAWDLFLDPQMAGEGYWRWEHPGRYRGIPMSNYVGWLLTGVVAMAVLEVTAAPAGGPDRGLVAEYGGVAAMETLGFAVFFRDRAVASVGGAAMLPLAVFGVLRAGKLV
jgi:uncharacterized membrane protein